MKPTTLRHRPTNMSEDRNLSVTHVLKRAWLVGRTNLRPIFVIVIIGIILPQILLSAYFDLEGAAQVDSLRTLTDTHHPAHTESTRGAKGLDFRLILERVAPYGLAYFGAALLELVLLICAYLSVIKIATTAFRSPWPPAAPVTTSGAQVFGSSLGLSFRRGLILVLLVAILLIISQAFLFAALILLTLSLIAPVIMIVENKGPWRSFWLAITFKWIKSSHVTGWAALMILIPVGSLLFVGLLATGYITNGLLYFDELTGYPRDLWAYRFGDLPFGFTYLGAVGFELLGLSFLVPAFACATTSLYFTLAGSQRIAAA